MMPFILFSPIHPFLKRLSTNNFSTTYTLFRHSLLGHEWITEENQYGRKKLVGTRVGFLDYLLCGLPVLLSYASWWLYETSSAPLFLLDVLVEIVSKVAYVTKWLISLPLTLLALPFLGLAHVIAHAMPPAADGGRPAPTGAPSTQDGGRNVRRRHRHYTSVAYPRSLSPVESAPELGSVDQDKTSTNSLGA